MNVYDKISANNRKTAAILCAFPVALFATVFLFAFLIVKTGVLEPGKPTPADAHHRRGDRLLHLLRRSVDPLSWAVWSNKPKNVSLLPASGAVVSESDVELARDYLEDAAVIEELKQTLIK
jgi:hypothetical protein